jgi:hypothetical protein
VPAAPHLHDGSVARRFQLLLTLLGLVGCVEDACELDMTVSGWVHRTFAWRDAECTLYFGYDWPTITIEHDGYTLEIYTYESTFSPGVIYADAEYFDLNGHWEFNNCTVDLRRAELEPWTRHDHWILEGSLYCPDDPYSLVQLSNIEFYIYQAVG